MLLCVFLGKSHRKPPENRKKTLSDSFANIMEQIPILLFTETLPMSEELEGE